MRDTPKAMSGIMKTQAGVGFPMSRTEPEGDREPTPDYHRQEQDRQDRSA